MERFWPKYAGENIHGIPRIIPPVDDPIKGVRYNYGDLSDVIMQLFKDPLTRQAYLPVFFPEDTGNTMNKRVPCTLGYHFILRNDMLHVNYYMRSCDYMRHFADDVYLACLLVGYIHHELCRQDNEVWGNVRLGLLTMYITSFHVFESDMYSIKKRYEKNNKG